MTSKRICCILALGMAWVFLASATANAAGPWDQLLSLRRVEADPNKSYQVTEDDGPWMIMASCFSGEGAEQQAHELVIELRKRYNLPAFIHKARFDLGEQYGRGIGRNGGLQRMRLLRKGGSEIKECAVLVGNYRSFDDPDAQRTLRKLKYTTPNALDIEKRGATTQSLAGWRMIQQSGPEEPQSAAGVFNMGGKNWSKYNWRSVQKEKKLGPMGHAFVATNPLLSKEFFAPKGVDPEVAEWNKKAKYSLLKCPGKYTVQVATFKGHVVIKQDEIRAIESGRKKMRSELEKAEWAAHRVAVALRVKGWEAYEFHDRNASIVTVGSFDSVGAPRADGKLEINPDIYLILRTFGAEQGSLAERKVKSIGIGTDPKKPIVVSFDIQPVPVEVPKRSISRELASGR